MKSSGVPVGVDGCEDAKHIGVTGLEASLSLRSLESLESLDTELPPRLGGDVLLHSDEVRELRLTSISFAGVRFDMLGLDNMGCSRVFRLILSGGGMTSPELRWSDSVPRDRTDKGRISGVLSAAKSIGSSGTEEGMGSRIVPFREGLSLNRRLGFRTPVRVRCSDGLSRMAGCT